MTGHLGTSAERADTYGLLAAEADDCPATTFTDDDVYAALGRLVDVLTRQHADATHIRRGRT